MRGRGGRMPKTSEQMKQMVEEYIKITKVKYEDQTQVVRSKTQTIDWQFYVGDNIIVSKNANREDRIHINVNMRFMPQDTKLLVPSNPAFAKAAIEISGICTACGVGHQWINAGGEVVGLAIFSHVDEQVLDRVTFHNAWDNVARVSGHMQKILRANLGNLAKGTAAPSGGPAESSIYG